MNLTVNPQVSSVPLQHTRSQSNLSDSSKTTIAESPKLNQDTVTIRSNPATSLKGAGAGLLVGLATGYGAAVAIESMAKMGSGALALMAIPIVGGSSGLVAGAVSANFADTKTTGAALGAATGGVVGGAVGLLFTGGNIKLSLMGAGIGAALGSLSGAAGVAVNK